MTPAEVIAECRRRAGLTQAELAAAAGCRQASVSDWERGRREAMWSTVERLAAACGCELRVRVVRRRGGEKGT